MTNIADFVDRLIGVKASKTEDGVAFSVSAYLHVPDPDKPSTWKLRIEESPGRVTVAQLGRAAAALGPGFRGRRVDLEPDERRKAARKLIALYRKQDVDDADIPDYLWGIADMKGPAEKSLDLADWHAWVRSAFEAAFAGKLSTIAVRDDHVVAGVLGMEHRLLRVPYRFVRRPAAGDPGTEVVDAIEFAPESEWTEVVPTYVEFKTFKQADGSTRWVTVSSGGFLDRDGEIVSTEFLRSAVEQADETGERGPLLIFHVPGSNVGHCDYQAVIGEPGFLLESGVFEDTKAGRRAAAYFSEKTADYGVSIKFLYANRSDQGVYYPPGVILERSLLPRDKAAFPWSTMTIAEVNAMSRIDEEKQRELERVLGTEIAAQIVEQLEASAEELKEMGVAWKEAQQSRSQDEQEEGEPQEKAAGEAGEGEGEAQPEAPAIGELVLSPEALEAVAEKSRQAFGEELHAVQASVESLVGVIEKLARDLQELRQSDEERIAEKVAHLPKATVRYVQAQGLYRPTRDKGAETDEQVEKKSLLEVGLAALYGNDGSR